MAAFGLATHRVESFTSSKDPLFVEKVRDVVGLYLDPPERALVLCVDEKSQIQALNRTEAGVPAAARGAGAAQPRRRPSGCHQVRFSITVRQDRRIQAAIANISEDAWTPIPYWLSTPEVSGADVAEISYVCFTGRDPVSVRLIVRRVRPTPGSQLALFTNFDYHAFVTNRDGQTLDLEADHHRARRHPGDPPPLLTPLPPSQQIGPEKPADRQHPHGLEQDNPRNDAVDPSPPGPDTTVDPG